MCPNAPKFTVFLRPESLMLNMDRNPVLWRALKTPDYGTPPSEEEEEEEEEFIRIQRIL